MKRIMRWVVFLSFSGVLVFGAYATSDGIAIDSVDKSVVNSVTQVDLSGTMEGMVGSMAWENDRTAASGSFPAVILWSVNGIALAAGTNIITVSGENAQFESASDFVTIIRRSTPLTYYVPTNGLPVEFYKLEVEIPEPQEKDLLDPTNPPDDF